MAHNDTNTKCLAKKYLSLVLFFLCAQAQVQVALATPEAFCPDGASPDANVIFCRDFDEVANCTDGTESQCWDDNGYSPGSGGRVGKWIIENDGGAVGNGYLKLSYPFGGPSGGNRQFSIGSETTMTCRYYLKGSQNWVTYQDHHGPMPMQFNGGGCTRGANLELSFFDYAAYLPSNGNAACGYTGTIDLYQNQTAAATMRGGKWYRIESQFVMDTSCSNSTSATGCNGQFRLWIDGVKTHEYTNVNLGGVAGGVVMHQIEFPNSYYHIGFPFGPDVQGELMMDNLVCRDDTTLVGAASSENALGTPANKDYYASVIGWNGVSRQLSDCWRDADSSRLIFNYGSNYRDGSATVTLDTAITNDDVDFATDATDCPTEAAMDDASLKVVADPGEGGGRQFDITTYPDGAGGDEYFGSRNITYDMYLPSGQTWSDEPPLAGWRGYQSINQYRRWIALAVQNGNWAVTQLYYPGVTSPVVIESGTAATFDVWNRIEFTTFNNGTFSLRVNDTQIFDGEAMTASGVENLGYTDLNADGGQGPVIGIIHNPSGSATITAYFDNAYEGAQSPYSCDGWHVDDCPFSGSSSSSSGPTPAGNSFVGVIY